MGFLIRIGFIFRSIGRDEAAFLYYGWMIVNGKVLYRDLFNQKAPGVYFIVALIFLFTGKQILLIRIVSMFLSTTTALVIFKIGHKISNPLTGIISALFFGSLIDFIWYSSGKDLNLISGSMEMIPEWLKTISSVILIIFIIN